MTLERLLERYGQTVEVHCGGEGAGITARAFIQPVLEKQEGRRDELPTPLGMVRQERLVYLGSPEISLEGMKKGFVEYRGRRYDVQGAQPVYVGERISHWWAMLLPRDREDED